MNNKILVALIALLIVVVLTKKFNPDPVQPVDPVNPDPTPDPTPDPVKPVNPDDLVIVIVEPEPMPIPFDPEPVPVNPEPITPDPVIPTPIPVPVDPEPIVEPGDKVQWQVFEPLKNLSNPKWGDVLTDIENHLHPRYGTQYRFADKSTWTHETLHGVNNYLYNDKRPNSRSMGFYVGNNKCAFVNQPTIRIADIAKKIPTSLRKGRYNLYLINQQRDWNDDPLYLFDEWLCYISGAECSAELLEKKLDSLAKTDSLWGVLEFSVYATYVYMVAKEKDVNYDFTQLHEFVAYNLKRSFELYEKGKVFNELNWDDDAYLSEIRSGAACEELRVFLRKTYGDVWVNKLFTHNPK